MILTRRFRQYIISNSTTPLPDLLIFIFISFIFIFLAICKHFFNFLMLHVNIALRLKCEPAHTNAPVQTGRRVEKGRRGLSGVCWSPWPAGLCSAAPADCKQITHWEYKGTSGTGSAQPKINQELNTLTVSLAVHWCLVLFPVGLPCSWFEPLL